MRIGAPGAEKPAVRIDEECYVDVSDIVERFRTCSSLVRTGLSQSHSWFDNQLGIR